MGWFSKLVFGVDLDEAKAQGDAADAGHAALNQEKLEKGTWTQQQFDEASVRLAAGAMGDPNQQVADEFKAGVSEGIDNLANTTNAVIAAPFKFAWKAIPWQIYVVAAVALFFWMGGAALLRGRLSR